MCVYWRTVKYFVINEFSFIFCASVKRSLTFVTTECGKCKKLLRRGAMVDWYALSVDL